MCITPRSRLLLPRVLCWSLHFSVVLGSSRGGGCNCSLCRKILLCKFNNMCIGTSYHVDPQILVLCSFLENSTNLLHFINNSYAARNYTTTGWCSLPLLLSRFYCSFFNYKRSYHVRSYQLVFTTNSGSAARVLNNSASIIRVVMVLSRDSAYGAENIEQPGGDC